MSLQELLLYIVNMPEDVSCFVFVLIGLGVFLSAFVFVLVYLLEFLYKLFDRWLDKKFPLDKKDKENKQ